MNTITNNLIFGILLSLIAFEIGLFINKKTKLPILNPLLIAIVLVILFLLSFNIDLDTYNQGAQFINMFLGPSTVILAVPLYKQINLLKKNASSIIIGILFGSTIGICSIILLCYILKLDSSIIKSLIPKSVTTPIGMEISKQLNGIVSITVLAIIISGIVGAILGPFVCKVFRIKDSIAIGISIGTASHAVGTTTALKIGEVEGAMSSLAIGVAGLMTVFLAPTIYNLAHYIYMFIK